MHIFSCIQASVAHLSKLEASPYLITQWMPLLFQYLSSHPASFKFITYCTCRGDFLAVNHFYFLAFPQIIASLILPHISCFSFNHTNETFPQPSARVSFAWITSLYLLLYQLFWWHLLFFKAAVIAHFLTLYSEARSVTKIPCSHFCTIFVLQYNNCFPQVFFPLLFCAVFVIFTIALHMLVIFIRVL